MTMIWFVQFDHIEKVHFAMSLTLVKDERNLCFKLRKQLDFLINVGTETVYHLCKQCSGTVSPTHISEQCSLNTVENDSMYMESEFLFSVPNVIYYKESDWYLNNSTCSKDREGVGTIFLHYPPTQCFGTHGCRLAKV